MVAYFILFATVILIGIWGLQVVMLNYFYGTMKTNQTKEVVQELHNSYKTKSTDRFLKDVEHVSDTYDMYIYVSSYDGTAIYFKPSGNDISRLPGFENEEDANDDGVPYKYAAQIQTLRKHMLNGEGSAYVKIKGADDSQVILAYGGLLQSKDKEHMAIFMFSPLWPMSSTVRILASNLVLVTIIALLIACLISVYLSTRITRPIRKMEKTAKRLADGEYGIVFKGGHYSELVNLADTLTSASIELEKSDMMHKDLMANVSHDLKTPLTMIKSYAEMIRDLSGDIPEKRNQHLQVIMDEADRLNGLVNDMLTVSRLQSGKLTLEASDFDLTESVDNILNTYRVKELDSSYTFNFESAGEFYVHADKEKIQQVISNFITNALKFCGDDKTINISLIKKGRMVELSVEDHGSGIAPEEIDHIWERYYRSSSNMVRETEGSGLGLSICKEILSLHKIQFGVDSTLGQGSRFWFQLPIVKKPVNS
ncbi:MAG: HAMP domain-containing sensor histidine kinase [Firmicutes bacterium]|nr:HAMP domain-containing sensor histidine kinase [Bacillota bacterium]